LRARSILKIAFPLFILVAADLTAGCHCGKVRFEIETDFDQSNQMQLLNLYTEGRVTSSGAA
jgi:hypothetical protein